MEVTRRASSLGCLAAILVSLLPSGPAPVYLTAHAKGTRRATASVDGSGIYSLTATQSADGVLLTWQHDYESNNLGFNVYQLIGKGRVKLNRDVVPGSVFISPRQAELFPTNSYAFLDRHGRQDSTYAVEAVSVEGELALSAPVLTSPGAGFTPADEAGSETLQTAGQASNTQSEYAAAAIVPPGSSNGPIADQWAVVEQPGLKIGIKRDGWYRVTHQQTTAAGFNPVVDVRNLRLFVDGREIRIRTSKSSGPFSSGDYFEFFGRGLDIATTDTRIHYLIAGTQAGKRIRGEMHTSSEPPATVQSSTPFGSPTSYFFPFIFRFLYGNESRSRTVEPSPASSAAPEPEAIASQPGPALSSSARVETADKFAPPPKPAVEAVVSTPSVAAVKPEPIKVQESRQQADARKPLETKRRAKKRTNKKKRKYAHTVNTSLGPQSFGYTVQRKDRRVYFLNLLNGDTENYFGDVLTATPVTQSLNTPNPEPTAGGPARFEVALQGIGATFHQIEVRLNGVLLGTMNFFGAERLVRTFNVPLANLNNGSNSVNFTTVSGGVVLVDYTRITYPHALRADSNSLRFALRPNHAVTISGFTISGINLLDHTDPYNVQLSKPITESNGGGFAIKIEQAPAALNTRLLNAFPEGQFETPATFSLNQPSTLNRNTNSADLLIIAHKSLIPAAAPLVTLRQSQGLTVKVVDVEDVFDEFSFGTHAPQSIKDLLARATSTWTKAPRYVILLGDASHDPRNYEGRGDFDLVPTKLLGATFNETASDDWLSDFNNDGLAEIPMGRLPARTVAEANLLVSKIVNFAPAAVPQSALLVADDPTNYYFNFETANDEVQSLLPSSMGVERINRRTDPNARTNLINKFNSGQALVNYTGHGNVDTWSGAQMFTNNDAARLFNAVSIVISQVYGGGGEAGATYRNDFVELFNRGAWPVNLSGWSIQYASGTGTSWEVTNLPNVVVQPGKYFLIQLAQGPGGTTNLPAPDATGTTNVSEVAGKVALLNTTSALASSGCPLSSNVVDLIGYGGANCSRGTAAAALTTTTAALRGNNGCTNTNVNAADFSSNGPAPRNSATAPNLCINASSRLPLSFVVVMDCLNGYFQDPFLPGLTEVLMKAPNGGSVAAFASSGLTIPDGQHAMARQLYILLYGSQSIALGDAVKTAKAATTDIDVRNTWIFFGDPSMKIR